MQTLLLLDLDQVKVGFERSGCSILKYNFGEEWFEKTISR